MQVLKQHVHIKCINTVYLWLTLSDLDWPDQDGAESERCKYGHASCYGDHDVMIEPHAGRTARQGPAFGKSVISFCCQ